jgi:mannitol-specific phosphotransferase system IIBC component
MHSMVGSFSPYTVKRRRAELVRGYCYRFLQCSFPCGIVMLILSILLLLVGSSQLIYIFHFNGCNPNPVLSSSTDPGAAASATTTDRLAISSSWKCNRHTVKVLGITFVVTGAVTFLISGLITKYSRSGEENNVIRTTTSSLLANNSKTSQNAVQQSSSHYYHTPSSSINDQNNIVVSIR